MNKEQWLTSFKEECPTDQFLKALKYADTPHLPVYVFFSDETGEPLFAVTPVENMGFWLYAFETKEEAVNFCSEMNWNIVSSER